VTLSGGAAQFSVNVTTTGKSAGLFFFRPSDPIGREQDAALLLLAGAGLCALVIFRPVRRRRSQSLQVTRPGYAPIAVLLSVTLLLGACAAGPGALTSTTPPGSAGAALTGTYILTVTATDGAASQALPLTLNLR
jgi:hypothetical protein